MAIQQILYYKIQGEGMTVTGFKKPDNGTLIIPEQIDGIPVTAISARAFWGHPMSAVVLPASIQTIGPFAFSGCDNLTEVQIPEGVTFLQEGTFRHCRRLERLSLPASLLRVGPFAFHGCGSLTQIDFAGTKLQWARIAVGKGNSALLDNTVRTDVVRTETAAADESPKPEQPQQPSGRPAPEDADLPAGLHYKILGQQAVITDFSDRSCTHLSIPDTIEGHPVTAIGELAFHNCSALVSIRIPGSVIHIGRLAFGDCSGLEEVFYNSIPMRWRRIVIAAGNESLMQAALCFPNHTDALLPSCLRYKHLGEETVILDCRPSSLRELVIPDCIEGRRVTRIADGAFLDCSSLERIELPLSLTHIGYRAFAGCTGLQEVFYAGTREEGSALSIEAGNERLTEADFFFTDTLPVYGQTG